MSKASGKEIVLGVSGASGAALPVRFLELVAPHSEIGKIHLIVSPSALEVAGNEIGRNVGSEEEYLDLPGLDRRARGKIELHSEGDLAANISSGSYSTAGMVVLPCSAGTLASIAHGVSRGLLARAADVTLKERRPLVLAFRESPYSLVHIENMKAVTLAGAIVMPPSPPFYIQSPTAARLIDAFLCRVAKVFGITISEEFVWTGPRRRR